MGIKHPFSSAKTDQADGNKVRPSAWNQDHVIDGDVDVAGHALTNVADEAYNSTAWDGNNSAPTKNAIRDKIEALTLGTGASTIITPRGSTLTIAAGAITVTDSFHYVDTEAAASFDQLDTINGGSDGHRVVLAAANAARTVFIRDDAGNIRCGNDGFQLDDVLDTIELIYDGTQAKWLEVSRFGGEGYTGVKNVMDYGAVGDGVADDTAAIQLAVDDNDGPYGGLKEGTIFFPAGTYKVTSPIQYGGNNDIRFLGEGGAVVEGTFNGFLFEDVFGGFNYASKSFENLRLNQSSTTPVTSGCIKVGDVITCLVKSCTLGLRGGIGVYSVAASDVTLLTCALTSDHTPGGIGFMAGNASTSINCDYVGFDEAAIQHRNIGLNVIGGRFEVNGRGIVLGREANGGSSSSANVFISGVSMESNDIHIRVAQASTVAIQGCGMHSFLATNDYGIYVTGGNGITIDGCGVSSGGTAYNIAAISLDMTSPDVAVNRVTIRNTEASSWFVSPEVDTTSWDNTNYTPAFTNRYNKRDFTTFDIPPEPDVFPVTATIAAGVITVAANYMVIDTEGAAATDDLDTISGAQRGSTGSRLVLRAANSARTVVVKDGTGNLKLAGDFSLDNVEDTIQLLWDANTGATGFWYEISRSDNGA